MMKMIPHNPVYLVAILLLPWRWGKTYINIEDNLIQISRYYCFDGKSLRRDFREFYVSEIEKIGFSGDFGIEMQEKVWASARGIYISQEIDFITTTNVIGLNARPYTKKQIRSLIQTISELNSGITCGKQLSRAIKL